MVAEAVEVDMPEVPFKSRASTAAPVAAPGISNGWTSEDNRKASADVEDM